MIKDITELSQGSGCNNHTGSTAVCRARFQREGCIVKANITTAANKVYGAVDVAVFPIRLCPVIHTIVCILIGEHPDILANRVVA